MAIQKFYEYTEILPLEESDGTSKPPRALDGGLHLLFVNTSRTSILCQSRSLSFNVSKPRQRHELPFGLFDYLLSPHQSRKFLRD